MNKIMKFRPAYWLIACICVLSNGIEWDVNNLTLTPERALSPLLFTAALIYAIHKKTLRISKAGVLIVVWIFFGFISSLFSPAGQFALRMHLAQAIATTFFFLPALIKFDFQQLLKSFAYKFLVVFFGPILLVIYVIYTLNPTDHLQLFIQTDSAGARLRGPIIESNIFAVVLTFFIFTYFAKTEKLKLTSCLMLLFLHASLIASFSRFPWISYIIGFGVYELLMSKRNFNIINITRYFIAGIATLILIGIAAYYLFMIGMDNPLIGRVHSIQSRLVLWDLAISSVLERPFFGNGTFSFREIYNDAQSLVSSENERSVWISNLYLAVVHDTGLVGLISFLTAIYICASKTIELTRIAACGSLDQRRDAKFGAALIAFGVVILVSGNSIPTHSLAFFWLAFGLIDQHFKQMKNSTSP